MALSGNQKAYTYALSNVARSGATRSGYMSGAAFISIGGVWSQGDVEIDSIEIVDELNETPNTCRFRLIGRTTTTGTEVIIALGSKNGIRTFAGHVLSTSQSYWAKPANLRQDVVAVDYSWLFGFLKATESYVGFTASDIASLLIVKYAAPYFSGNAVAPNLPRLPEITYTQENLGDAFSRLAARIGAYWYVDYFHDVHLFFTDVGTPPTPLTATHPSLANVQLDTDTSQAITRVYVEGRGSRILGAVLPGDSTVPLEAVDMFSPVTSDVFLKASFQGSSGGAQHLNYAGVVTGGGGTLVGPGIGPSAAPTLTRAVGTGVTAGDHAYGVTFVTATGESLPSPTASITAGGQVLNPTEAPTGWTPPSNYFGNLHKLGFYKVKYAYATDTAFPPANVTLASPPSASIQANTNTGATSEQGAIQTSIPCSSDPTVTRVHIYRTTNGGSTFYHATVATNVPGTVLPSGTGSSPSDAAIVSQGTEPVANTTPSSGAVALTAIPIGVPPSPGGVSPVTQRKVYRTAANSGALKFLVTLPNNTATTYTDTSPDASLGAAVPTGDTSGLTQPAGQVLPGSTRIPVAAAGPFQPDLLGGWAIIGNGEQAIRYGGNSLGELIGIPTSGIGSITAAVVYNSTITAAPMLTGIPASGTRSITRALTAGDELYLVVQVDDTARQAQLAAFVGNGVREEWIQDRRLSITEARARGEATLALRPLGQQQLSYTCRDVATRSGQDIDVDLPAPTSISGTFKIQHVVINNFRGLPGQFPTFTVQASSTRFSFEDLLRVATRDVTR